MSNIAIDWAIKIQDLPQTAKALLVVLANRANHNHEAWPSWKTLILETSMDRKTVYKGLITLQSKGYLMKIGSTKGRVCIYRLAGIEQENLSTTSPKIGTTQSYPHSPKNGTIHSPNIGTTHSSKNGTQNHNKKPKRNPKAKDVPFLTLEDLVKTRLEVAVVNPPQDLISQVLFYVKSKPSGDSPEKWVNIAISVVKKKQWKTPEGWEGITSQSIAKKEEEYFRQKSIQQIEDDKAAIRLNKEILERGIITPISFVREQQPKQEFQPSQKFLNNRAEMRKSLGL